MVDAEAGTVRLKTTSTRPTRWRSTRAAPRPPASGRSRDHASSARTATQSDDPEWCDTCGAPIGGRLGGAGCRRRPLHRRPPGRRPPRCARRSSCPHCGGDEQRRQPVLRAVRLRLHHRSGARAGRRADADRPSRQALPRRRPSWVVVVEVDPAWYRAEGRAGRSAVARRRRRRRSRSPSTPRWSGAPASRADCIPRSPSTATPACRAATPSSFVDGDRLSVVDLSSTNGTYVLDRDAVPTSALRTARPRRVGGARRRRSDLRRCLVAADGSPTLTSSPVHAGSKPRSAFSTSSPNAGWM